MMGNVNKAPHLVNVEINLLPSNDDGLNASVSCWTGKSKYKIGPFSTDIETRAFHLNFVLKDAKSPLDSWAYAEVKPDQAVIKIKSKVSDSQSDKINNKISFSAKSNSELGASADIGNEISEDSKIEKETEIDYIENRISCRGTKTAPSWSFNKLPYESSLKGMLIKEAHLFKVYAKNSKASLDVEIEFPENGIIVNRSYKGNSKQNSNTNVAGLYIRWILQKKPHKIDNIKISSGVIDD